MAYQSLASLGAQPQQSSSKPQGRPGWLSALIGQSGFDPLGVGHTVKSLTIDAIPGLWNLGESLLPGGQKSLLPQAAKGLASSFGSTVEDILPGSQAAIGPLTKRFLGPQFESKPWYQRSQNGILGPISEDLLNASLVGGGVENLLKTAGDAATKASVLSHATEAAATAGADTSALASAAEKGAQLGAEGRYLGPFSPALREAGLRGSLRDVAQAAGRLEKAGGPAAAATARGSQVLLPAAEAMAHPISAAIQGLRPLSRAAQALDVSRVTEPLSEASAANDAWLQGVRPEAPAQPGLGDQAVAAATKKPAPAEGLSFSENVARAQAQADAADRVVGRAAADVAKQADAEQRLKDLGAIPPQSGPVRGQLLARADQPIPEWAANAVGEGGKLNFAQPLLSKAEGFMQGRETQALFHETRRFMEAERRNILSSGAVQASTEAARVLTDQFGVDPLKATRMVGDQLMSELDQRNMLLAGRQLFPDNPQFESMMQEAIGRDHPMTGDQLAAVRPLLDQAHEQWQTLADQRTKMLLGSPERGAQGLTSLDFDPAAVDPSLGLSPGQAKQLNQLVRDYGQLLQSDTAEGRAARMRQRAVLGAKSKLDAAYANLEQSQTRLSDQQRAVIEQALPAPLQAANRATTATTMLSQIMDGGTYDPWTNSLVTDQHADAAVASAGDIIPMAEWQANPGAAFDKFVTKYASMLNDQDAKVGVWSDGNDVYLDVTQTTHNGQRLSREQAMVLGMARGEKAIWDFQKGDEAWLPRDATSMAVAQQHALEVMKPGSQFNRVLRQWGKARNMLEDLQSGDGAVKVDPASWDAKLQTRMRIASTAVSVGRYPSLDAAYGQMAVEAAKTAQDVPHAMLQVYLAPSVESAMQSLPEDWNRALAQVGPQGKKALDWYFDGYDTVASRWDENHTTSLPRQLPDGTWQWKDVSTRDLVWSIMAVTSTNTAPLPNAAAAFDGITAWSDYMKNVDPSKVADVVQQYQDAVKEARVKYGNGTKFTKDLPELVKSELWDKVGKAVPHTGSIGADVLDILTERLVPEWTNDWLFERLGRTMPDTIEGAKKLLGGKHEIPANYEQLVAAARSGDADAEAAIRDLYGSKGYAKIRNFFANLSAPHQNRGVTLDRVMAQAFGLGSEDWSGAVYDKVVNMVSGLADDLSQMYGHEILPHQVQALRWVGTKSEMAGIELGRRQAVYADAVNLLGGDAPQAAEAFAAGADPVSQWYRDEIAFAQGEGQGKIAERTQPMRLGQPVFPQSGGTVERRAAAAAAREQVMAAEAEQRPFLSKISKGEEFDQLQRNAAEWEKKRAKIADALASGKRQAASDLLDSWIGGQQSAFNQPAQYFSDYATADTRIRGLGEKVAESSQRAQATDFFGNEGKVLPPETPGFKSPSQVPEAGLPPLTPEQLDTLKASTQARWDRLASVETPDGMMQKTGEDLANGMTFLSDKTGRITERFFRTADPTTLLHEEAHVLRLMLPQEDIRQLLDAYPTKKITPPGQQAARAASLVGQFGKPGFEEWFAENAIRYFNTAEAPPGMGNVFQKVRDALANWWQASGDHHSQQIDPQVAELLNRWFDPVSPDGAQVPSLGRDLAVPATKSGVYRFAQAEAARPGETPQQALKRGLTLGRSVERAQQTAADVATQQARVSKMEAAFADLPDRLAEMTLPPEAAKQAQLARMEGRINTLVQRGDHPESLAKVLPATWKPLAGAVDNLRDLAKQPGMEPLAEMMATIPDSLTGFMQYAVDNGFDPTHVASIPESKVRKLVFGRFAPGDEAVVAGTRKARAQAFPLDRSIEALAAAHMDVIREAQTGQFLQTVRDAFAQPVEAGQEIPKGWTEWDQVRRYMGVATNDEGIKQAIGPGSPRYMVPDQVAKSIQHMSKNYDFGVLQGIRKVTNPWRTMVLSLSPKWYLHRALGNLILSAAGGTKLADWVDAWRSYRAGDHVGNWAQQHFGPGTESFSGPERAVIDHFDTMLDRKSGASVLGQQTPGYGASRDLGLSKMQSVGNARTAFLDKLDRVHSVIDDLARTAVYNAGEAKGFTPEAALQRVSKVLVDYGDLGPVERSLVRSVVPFYGWQKGVLKIVGRLAVDHPQAVGVMWQLGKLNEELFAGIPDAYRSTMLVPGVGPVNMRFANPFASAPTLLTPAGIAGAVNPFLDVLARQAYDSPPNGYPTEYRIDDYGRAMPSFNPAQALGQIFTGTPQLQSVTGGPSGGTSIPAGIAGFAGVPQVRQQSTLDAAKLRLAKSQAKVQGLTPIQAGITQPKAKTTKPFSKSQAAGITGARPSLTSLG